MWFYDDKSCKFSRPDEDEDEDSAGFADPLGNGVTAFAWAFIIAAVVELTWAYQAGLL